MGYVSAVAVADGARQESLREDHGGTPDVWGRGRGDRAVRWSGASAVRTHSCDGCDKRQLVD
ncbi:hypothetical protein GCM10018966_013670 [Streptomyces yanii]